MVPGQQNQRRHQLWCCILVILAALLLVAAGFLLDRPFQGASAPIDAGTGLPGELAESLISFLPIQWLAGVAALVAAGCLRAAFYAVTGDRPETVYHSHLPGQPAFTEDAPGAVADSTLPDSQPAALQAWAAQANLLADSLAAVVANAARVAAAGSQADAAAGQGTMLLTRIQEGLHETVGQTQLANDRLVRLASYSQQVEGLLAALQERGIPARRQAAGQDGAEDAAEAPLWDVYRREFKQLAIMIKTMDVDARDSHLLLDKTVQEIHVVQLQAEQACQAVAEMGHAVAALAEEANLLHAVAQAQAEMCGEQADACAALAGLPQQRPPRSPAGGPEGAAAVSDRQWASI